MKRMRFLLCCVVSALAFFAAGCSDGGGSSAEGADVKINVLYADTSKNWNVWAWKGGTEINYSSKAWPGDLALTKNGSALSRTLTVDPNYDLGLLFCEGTKGDPQTKDITIPKGKLVAGAESGSFTATRQSMRLKTNAQD